MMRTTFFGILILAAAVTARVSAAPLQVERVSVADRKAVFATVESIDVVSARTRIGGTIIQLSVDEGSAVKEGEVVARVADPKIRLQISAIDARIQSLVSQKDLAKTAMERARNLRQSGTISQARLDEAQTALEVADRELAARRAERNVVIEQRTEGDVLAPKTGRVLEVDVTEGAVVLAGETVAMIATETYILRMSLPERHARFIAVGDAVLIGPRGMEAASGGALREGRIRQVYPEIKQGRVVADIDVDGLGDFFVGERMRVYVAAGSRETYVIPTQYLFRRQGVSFVKLENGIEAVVQPGLVVEGGIEILSGLQDGDVIVESDLPPMNF